jgi:hypothetical protein
MTENTSVDSIDSALLDRNDGLQEYCGIPRSIGAAFYVHEIRRGRGGPASSACGHARHPELRPGVIASTLKTYTRSLCYLETLKAGSARIDLEGNAVGAVTEADEEDAQRKIAKAARRAAAKTIEDRKAAAAPPMTRRVSQVEHRSLNRQRLPIYHPDRLPPRPSRQDG